VSTTAAAGPFSLAVRSGASEGAGGAGGGDGEGGESVLCL